VAGSPRTDFSNGNYLHLLIYCTDIAEFIVIEHPTAGEFPINQGRIFSSTKIHTVPQCFTDRIITPVILDDKMQANCYSDILKTTLFQFESKGWIQNRHFVLLHRRKNHCITESVSVIT